MWKWIVLGLVVIVIVAVVAITIYVEREAPFEQDRLAEGTAGKALILYHPSRDAHFADELTNSLARGFADRNLGVERWTMTGETPPHPEGFAVIAVVSNTFYQGPDWPTARYLARAEFKGTPVIAIMAGSGSTERAQLALGNAIDRTGARVLAVRSLWITRSNEPSQPTADNRQAAMMIARKLAGDAAGQAIAAGHAELVAASLATFVMPVRQ